MTELKRKCLVCGKELTIKVREDNTYEGGHFFGLIKGIEYWECEDCYRWDNGG